MLIKEFFGNSDAPEFIKFCEWAFGKDYRDIPLSKVPEKWNNLHGTDLLLYKDGDMKKDLSRMLGLWEKYK